IEKLLAPLFTLSVAEDVTGMARGVAFQLAEALGVLERQKVSEEVKGLDQPSRATLRKYGVRFGAYHIYLPALMKPAPRALATQLHALKHESADAHGVTELLHLAASGRTSIPVDKETPKALYRTSGYRVCGERAVRVDILERLADLIRPALAWREGTTPKPDGAIDGRGFTVTGAMTSLTGASGEDFASILRALGYRMERKPKPAEPAKSEMAAEAAPAAEAPAAEATATDTPAESAAEPAPEAEAPPLVADAEVMPAPVIEQPAEPQPEQPSAEAQAGQPPAEAASVEAAPAEEKPAEPAMIEVWRPGGRSEQQRPPRHRRAHQRPQQAAAAPADGAAVAAAPAAGESQEQRQGRPPQPERSDRPNHRDRQQRTDKQAN